MEFKNKTNCLSQNMIQIVTWKGLIIMFHSISDIKIPVLYKQVSLSPQLWKPQFVQVT